MSLYVKSTSVERDSSNSTEGQKGGGEGDQQQHQGGEGGVQGTKARQLIESMARRSVDVPADILLKPIREDNEDRY